MVTEGTDLEMCKIQGVIKRRNMMMEISSKVTEESSLEEKMKNLFWILFTLRCLWEYLIGKE